MSLMNTQTIVAIGGCSGAGKSTLCGWLSKKYEGLTVVHMDNFYRDISDPRLPWLEQYESKVADFDSPLAMDFEKFSNHLNTIQGLVIVEGIFVFLTPEIQDRMKLKYFLNIPFQKALTLRRQKIMKLEEPLDYFERVAWPMHVKSHRDALNDSSIKILEDNLGYEKIREIVCAGVEALLKMTVQRNDTSEQK